MKLDKKDLEYIKLKVYCDVLWEASTDLLIELRKSELVDSLRKFKFYLNLEQFTYKGPEQQDICDIIDNLSSEHDGRCFPYQFECKRCVAEDKVGWRYMKFLRGESDN